jgi:hypothetical protein
MDYRSTFEEGFFQDAIRRARNSINAIKAVRELREDPQAAFRIDFHLPESTAKGDYSMLVYAEDAQGVPPKVALLRIESGGRLMLMNNNHSTPRVAGELRNLADVLNWTEHRDPSDRKPASESLPTIPGGRWEHCIHQIVSTLRSIATNPQPVVAKGPVIKKAVKPVAGQSGPALPSAPSGTESAIAMLSNVSAAAAADGDVAESSEAASNARAHEAIEHAAGSAPKGAASVKAAEVEREDEDDGDGGDVGKKVNQNTPERRFASRLTRPGQPELRVNLLRAYGKRCCISGDGPPEALVAAHIEPHAEGGDSSVQNGLLLRADLHMLLDAGLLRIDPETRIVWIHDRAKPAYDRFHGRKLRPPNAAYQEPGREQLFKIWKDPQVE